MEFKKIIHMDMDAFYASIEKRDNPSLKNKPVIVGGYPNSRGVVSTCSYEARKFGIHSAMPCAKAYNLCRNAVFIRPRMDVYKRESIRIFNIYKKYTNLMETLSLDEAYLDVSQDRLKIGSATKTAMIIRKEVYSKTGLTVSAGVSYNKFLAKLASDMDKPDGITIITPDKAKDIIKDLPVGKFFGIGKATKNILHKNQIFTGKDIIEAGQEKLFNLCGKAGVSFFQYANGIDTRVVGSKSKRKSCGRETTFSSDIADKKIIETKIKEIAFRVSEILKRKDMKAYTITLKIRYHDFTTITRSRTSSIPFFEYKDILKNIFPLLGKTEIGRKPIRLVGVSTSNFENEKPRQLILPIEEFL